MTGPSGATAAGARFLALRRLSRQSGVLFDSILVIDAHEALLARLAVSEHVDRFVLKGGMLLAALEARRATRDVDLAAIDVSNESNAVLSLIADIASIDLDDGYEYNVSEAGAKTIREGDSYQGVRVRVPARLASARIAVQVDINVGDPIWPDPGLVRVPRVFGDQLRLLGYPIEMVLAEKIATAVDRGQTNTRWRDLADIWTLTHQNEVEAGSAAESLRLVAAHRAVRLQPLQGLLAGWAHIAQPKWAVWRRKQQQTEAPASIDDVIAWLVSFADPLMAGLPERATWDPARGWVAEGH